MHAVVLGWAQTGLDEAFYGGLLKAAAGLKNDEGRRYLK
jgi:hypothetical protein